MKVIIVGVGRLAEIGDWIFIVFIFLLCRTFSFVCITGTIIVRDILNLRDYADNDHSRGTVFSIKIPHCPGPSALVFRI